MQNALELTDLIFATILSVLYAYIKGKSSHFFSFHKSKGQKSQSSVHPFLKLTPLNLTMTKTRIDPKVVGVSVSKLAFPPTMPFVAPSFMNLFI